MRLTFQISILIYQTYYKKKKLPIQFHVFTCFVLVLSFIPCSIELIEFSCLYLVSYVKIELIFPPSICRYLRYFVVKFQSLAEIIEGERERRLRRKSDSHGIATSSLKSKEFETNCIGNFSKMSKSLLILLNKPRAIFSLSLNFFIRDTKT